MNKYILLLLISSFYGCNQYSYFLDSSLAHYPDAPVSNENNFFKVGDTIFLATIPENLILEKVYLQNVEYVDGSNKKYYRGDCINKPINNLAFQNFENSLQTSLKKALIDYPEIKISWTNKNLPLSFSFKHFKPNEINLQELLLFYKLESNETVLLPLIRHVNNDEKIIGQSYEDTYMLTIAFYIFDKNQIYYAKSVGLSKTNFIQNSINPKDFTFLQSEWDYLVYEALRPLLEKGVELEIVGGE